MLNPIEASRELKEEFISYITTSFQISDEEYARQFREELSREGIIAKGPYLDISDSFKKGKSLRQMMEEGSVSKLFADLEGDLPDGKKELPLERTLYLHQEKAIEKAKAHKNMVVTTGTGSGKTECFTIPIINYLLEEKEKNGNLTPGVRAILIYPMNALANDQMKRLRDTLGHYKDITFGLYNGDTKFSKEEALVKYGEIYKDINGRALKPLDNEVICRQEMQEKPPHILVTNYAMLEYMLLRPKDDLVFSEAKLKFLVLDEAHTYKGATGMETSLLVRRLKARVSSAGQIINILTSATLGGKDADDEIINFAETLCDARFDKEDIIRSITEAPVFEGTAKEYPFEMFAELATPDTSLNKILDKYNVLYNAEESTEEILFDICLESSIYQLFRQVSNRAMTVAEIAAEMNKTLPTTPEDVVNLIKVVSQGEKNKTVLLKARYHMFVRALEGAFITIGDEKKLLLERAVSYPKEEPKWRVFEAVVCADCGRIGICGSISSDHLAIPGELSGRSYYLLKENDEEFEDDVVDEEDISENEYILCPECGEIHHVSQKIDFQCGHNIDKMPRIYQATKITDSGECKCPSCNTGNLRSFYIGYDAATSVLGTSLYEEIPESELILEKKQDDIDDEDDDLFGEGPDIVKIEKRAKQFLAFSDSRSEAAFFASNLSKYYKEFLRRRGIFHIVQENKENMINNPWDIPTFVKELAAYFNANRTFAEPGDQVGDNLTAESRKQAWIAVINEMVSARRGTSLSSLGVLRFAYKGNQGDRLNRIAERYNKDIDELREVFDLLVMDFAYYGALESADCTLTDDEREYVFFTTARNRFKLLRDSETDKGKSYIHAWIPAKKKNQKYYYNGRVKRLSDYLGATEEDTVKVLSKYWEKVLMAPPVPIQADGMTYFMDISSFLIIPSSDKNPVYRCDKCSRITMYNCGGRCSNAKCDGHISIIDSEKIINENHYARLYDSTLMKPLHIKEHTAQLGRKEQEKYQQMFVKKDINARSCSTTFEMGVDVGDLETVYLRNMPPSPANYVQRAGRAGRSLHSAAFALTYSKLSSHDFTYYKEPTNMIEGKIGVPVFTIQNDKVIQRHIFAVALSLFFANNPEIYNQNNAHVFLNEGGAQVFKEYLEEKPQELLEILKKSIPSDVCEMMGIDDFSWTDRLIGKDGVLTIAIEDYNDTIQFYQEEHDRFAQEGKEEAAVQALGNLKRFRRSPEDKKGRNELIEFLARNNILPKYGFPIDAVELYQDSNFYDDNRLQIMRDLQLAISEYAPDSKVVADDKMYTSRYIRKLPQKTGLDWELSYIARCKNPSCQTMNWSRTAPPEAGIKCISCQKTIIKSLWEASIEPRKGFIADSKVNSVPMTKPSRLYGSEACYIGDPQRHVIDKYNYIVNGSEKIKVETSANDSLMVVCNSAFFVCNKCGYAVSSASCDDDDSSKYKDSRTETHKSSRGKNCDGKLYKKKLSHTFKTDVVSIVFGSSRAKNKGVMLSVMYALLEATAKVLDIERTDISGCLHRVRFEGKIIHSIVLYDSVAGGAGHVRRLISNGGEKFQEVIREAINLTKTCTCDPSCYNCLRNYYNQKYHDILSRIEAYEFLENFAGEMTEYSENDAVNETTIIPYAEGESSNESSVSFDEPLINCSQRYVSWDEMKQLFPDSQEKLYKVLSENRFPLPDGAYVTITENNRNINSEALFVWNDKRILLFDEDQELIKIENWKSLYCNDIDEATIMDLV